MVKRHVQRFWSEDEKRRIVAQTRMPGVSVAQVARRYSRHAGWPPSPARILNHIQKKRGIPKDSVRLEIALAGLICLQQPTRGMTLEASKAGRVEIDGESYDRLQIRTIAEMLEGRGFDTPAKVKPFNWIRQGELDV